LEGAQALLAAIVQNAAAVPTHRVRQRQPRRRSAKALERSPTAHEAAKVLRAAKHPLHATAIVKDLKRRGHNVALGTLVSTLSRWVRSRSVFYRARPNVFGLISQRRGAKRD
jgi:hypothetical protein